MISVFLVMNESDKVVKERKYYNNNMRRKINYTYIQIHNKYMLLVDIARMNRSFPIPHI